MAEQPANGNRSEPDRDDDESPNGNPPAAFQRFEDLMHGLIRVPKSELDEKRKTA